MTLLLHCLCLLAIVGSAASLHCYSCLFTSYQDPNSVKVCDDPMDIDEAPTTECPDNHERCFASRLVYEVEGGTAWKVRRLCANTTSSICEDGDNPGDIPGAVYRFYCCSEDNCNSRNALTGSTPPPSTTPDSADHLTTSIVMSSVFVFISLHITRIMVHH